VGFVVTHFSHGATVDDWCRRHDTTAQADASTYVTFSTTVHRRGVRVTCSRAVGSEQLCHGTVYHSRLSLSLARSRVITRRLALAHTRRVARLRSRVAVPQVSLLARSVTRAAACARGAGVRSRCRSRAPDISPGSGERSVASRCRLHLRTWSTPSTHHSQHSLFPFSPRTSSTLSTQHSHHYPYLVGPLAHTVHSLKIM